MSRRTIRLHLTTPTRMNQMTTIQMTIQTRCRLPAPGSSPMRSTSPAPALKAQRDCHRAAW
jgi:hypothetical protein